jgi:hypothetical protein
VKSVDPTSYQLAFENFSALRKTKKEICVEEFYAYNTSWRVSAGCQKGQLSFAVNCCAAKRRLSCCRLRILHESDSEKDLLFEDYSPHTLNTTKRLLPAVNMKDLLDKKRGWTSY